MTRLSGRRAVRAVLLGLLLGLLLTQFGATLMRVEGHSMLPTLKQGQVVLVARPPVAALIRLLSGAEHGVTSRGAIVVLPDPFVEGPFLQLGRPLIVKRVVGLPGEQVALRRGQLLVDGQGQPEPWLDAAHTGSPSAPPTLLPPGWVYLLGDNRLPLASSDSRQFGPQPVASLRGLVLARLRQPWEGGRLRWPVAPLS